MSVALLLASIVAALLPASRAVEVRTHLALEPAACEIGQPVAWILTVEHSPGATVRATTPELDRSWILLEDQRRMRVGVAAGAAPGETRIEWTIAALEPGARALPSIPIEVEDEGGLRSLTAEGATLEVRPALAPGEDAPRPQRGFRPPPPDAVPAARWPWITALLLVSAAALSLFLRKRKKRAPVLQPTPLEQLAALEQRAAAEPDAARQIVYEASRLLRDSIDARLGETRVAATDEDWAARAQTDERLPLGVRTASARLLSDAQRIKYALVVPTRFALEEHLRDLRHVLEALAAARIDTAGTTSSATRVGEAA